MPRIIAAHRLAVINEQDRAPLAGDAPAFVQSVPMSPVPLLPTSWPLLGGNPARVRLHASAGVLRSDAEELRVVGSHRQLLLAGRSHRTGDIPGPPRISAAGHSVEENVEKGAEREPKVVEFTVYDYTNSMPVGTAGLFDIAHAHATAELRS
jgi:hypothetical protein